MKRAFSYRISFRVRHPHLSIAALTEGVGMTPVASWQAGDRRRTPKGAPLPGIRDDSYCAFDVAGGDDGEVAAHLADWLRRLAARRSFFQSLTTTGGTTHFYVSWYPIGDTGEVFEASLLRSMAELGIGLMLNVYGTSDDADD